MVMAQKRYSLHPCCKLFPRLEQADLKLLADDIRQNGLQNSIILLEGKILDGQNRIAACKIAGVEPRFKKWKGKGSPIAWVISQNLMRRHLTASQKAVVDFLVLLLDMDLISVEPQRCYLCGATGQMKGAKPMWGDLTPKELDSKAAQLADELGVSAIVVEDALCNWQK